ncbi:3-oxoacyl-ACP synthase III family protein [Falsigemmobacter faecalis]|uniref:Ketoacyl-ACP synthase III n=1 Tax=Falsigemmobacter faecalis TaxID=2488730 RepID=A0A3P3DLR0_9RHOB|nr:3-oxoacyl-[acyl-carrier-protein] synthase III C-terminal domain-containing protein [Falsigemmobacter faecalis]RRH73558.1 ketoacyl-ACP synthase III [Falsigemmobacter faecalis]
MHITLCGTGSALPQRRLTSAEIDHRLNRPEGWLEAACGVQSRYEVAPGEDQITLAVTAARQALADAGIAAAELSLVIGASAVPYQPLPATAPLLAGALGAGEGQLAAFDVNSSCLSFVTGFEVASRMLGEGQYGLIVSSELASRALPWAEAPEVAGLFGDGAGALVLRGGGSGRLAAALLRSYPSGWQACSIGSGGTRYDFHNAPQDFAQNAIFRMDGRELFRLTARHFAGFVKDLLARAGWSHGPDLVIPHQASPGGLAHMIRLTGFAPERVVNVAADYGNQIAASIPLVLDLARREGRVSPGTKVLILGTSAGVSFGGLALEI